MVKITKVKISFKQLICLALYYGIATHLPDSYSLFGGKISNYIRVFLCKRIFKKCGKIRTINRKVVFGSGRNIEMGDNSGIGANTEIPSDTIIGKNVMLSRRCFVLHRNHEFSRIDIPIIKQGFKESKIVARDGGNIAGNALRELEERTGRKVVSSKNSKNPRLLDENLK